MKDDLHETQILPLNSKDVFSEAFKFDRELFVKAGELEVSLYRKRAGKQTRRQADRGPETTRESVASQTHITPKPPVQDDTRPRRHLHAPGL